MKTRTIAPDAFHSLLALDELKKKTFYLLAMTDRINFSLVNKSSRNFFVQNIETALLDDLMQAQPIRLTTDFWEEWKIPNQTERLKKAIELLSYIQTDYPTRGKKEDFLKWLASDTIQQINNIEFWKVCLYKVLLNMGIEVSKEENHKLVTLESLAAVKAFILSQDRCRNFVDFPLLEFTGLYSDRFQELFQELDSDTEAATINNLIDSFKQASLHKLANRFKERMLVSFLKDDSEEATAAHEKTVTEHRLAVDHFTAHYEGEDQQTVRNKWYALQELYQYDSRTARVGYHALSKLSASAASGFLDYNPNDWMLDPFITLSNIQDVVQHFQQEQYGNFIVTVFTNINDFLAETSFIYSLNYLNNKVIYQIFDYFFKLYSDLKDASAELHILSPLLLNFLERNELPQDFIILLEKILQRSGKQELFKFVSHTGSVKNLDEWLCNTPWLYELHPDLLCLIDSDIEAYNVLFQLYSSSEKRAHLKKVAQSGLLLSLCQGKSSLLQCVVSLPSTAFDEIISEISYYISRSPFPIEDQIEEFYFSRYSCLKVFFNTKSRPLLNDFTLDDLEKAARTILIKDPTSSVKESNLLYLMLQIAKYEFALQHDYDLKTIIHRLAQLHDNDYFIRAIKKLCAVTHRWTLVESSTRFRSITHSISALQLTHIKEILQFIKRYALHTDLLPTPAASTTAKRTREETDGDKKDTDLPPKHKPYQAKNLTLFATTYVPTPEECVTQNDTPQPTAHGQKIAFL